MCGICGTTEPNIDLNQALKDLEHRGPDGEGVFRSERVTFGHRLLAIQDPGHASQPMQSQSGKSILSFNGEIYNHQDLRSLLPDFNWKTSSDSETIVELLDHFGTAIVGDFRGMFAIAFWNNDLDSLYLMRDKHGEKPLFYSLTPQGHVYFSSEVGSLSRLITGKKEISLNALAHYLKYLYFDPYNSIFSDIKSVMPGTLVRYHRGEVNFEEITSNQSGPGPIFSTDALRSAITLAVKRTLLADVPVGVMLSGGIDSSIVTAVASTTIPNIETFTLRRSDIDDEDAASAQLIAKKFNTKHHEVVIDESRLSQVIYFVLSRASQPFADTSIVPTYLISEYASNYVKVLLSGDGADELFGGYKHYDKYQSTKVGAQSVTSYGYKYLLWNLAKRTPSKKIRKYYSEMNLAALESGRRTFQEQWNLESRILTNHQVRKILGIVPVSEKFRDKSVKEINSMRSILDLDLGSYLPADILFKSDTAGMLASIEVRAPFLDLDLRRLRDSMTEFEFGNSKKCLTEAFSWEIPDTVVNRKKIGFGAPVELWFKNREVFQMSEDLIKDKLNPMYQFLNFKEVSKIVDRSHHIVRWEFMSLAIWMRENLT